MLTPIFVSAKLITTRTWSPLVQQLARAHRKPRWLPVAKSKVFRIPKRPVVPEDEKKELTRITNNYHTQMRAIRRFYHEEMLADKSSRLNTSSEESLTQERLEFERSVRLNEEWNARVAAEREVRLAEERGLVEQRALARIEEKDAKLRAQVQRADTLIRKEKELSVSFVTPETLDAAIEHALANPVDHNFAIDLHGNQTLGRHSAPGVPGTATQEANK